MKDFLQKCTTSKYTRRDCIRDMSIAGLGIMSLSSLFQSCAQKEIPLTSNLAEAYIEGILNIVDKIRERELSKISQAATLSVQARLQGHKLFSHISGGMLPSDIEDSRPGSPNVFNTINIQDASRNDVVVTNRPEIVRGFTEQWVKVIGITTPSIPNSNTTTTSGIYENLGVLRIEDVSDIVIFCHVPYTDGILDIKGIDIPICPATSVIHSIIYYALAAEIVEGLTNNGVYPLIG